MSGYIYTQSEEELWTVGTGEPGTPTWRVDSDHGDPEEAAARVAYLNGAGRSTALQLALGRLSHNLPTGGEQLRYSAAVLTETMADPGGDLVLALTVIRDNADAALRAITPPRPDEGKIAPHLMAVVRDMPPTEWVDPAPVNDLVSAIEPVFHAVRVLGTHPGTRTHASGWLDRSGGERQAAATMAEAIETYVEARLQAHLDNAPHLYADGSRG